ncbi:lasso peptide [Rubellimicrobium aerolatum]|uniref:Lasso peptide n=1 Tax=Rubellimicrobium aerolatum TaxID=490979 RepID=A0ABW0S958_9RHOB
MNTQDKPQASAPAAYSAPKLTVHGSVAELTAAGSSGRPEAGSRRQSRIRA